ncbi:outer membrane protein assembly factor BamD [bacterium]|nr:outer membrane protein assembly factor BamD [bacterium]
MIRLLLIIVMLFSFFAGNVYSYWIWTPKTKQWINPKHAAKDIPKDQFDWAMTFFQEKQYKRAIKEFRKLINAFPKSQYAAESQFYIGEILMNLKKYYDAYLQYQKTVEKYPGTKRMIDILERELQIANYYFYKKEMKVAGVTVPKMYDVCIDIYSQIVKNAPYAQQAEKAQFLLAEAYRLAGRFDEASTAYKTLVSKYPESQYVVESKYKIALCESSTSLESDYDSKDRETAIKEFEKFTQEHGENERVSEARDEMSKLVEQNAKKMFDIASFYEKQKKYKAAVFYYEDLYKKYPDTEYGAKAHLKIDKFKDLAV